MDYKKKYEELLARLQEAKENAYKTDERYCCVIDSIVPELNESESEKIRKWTIENIQETLDVDGFFEGQKTMAKNAIAWLKKQGQTFTKKDVDDAYLKGVCDAKHELEKQGEKGTNGNEREIPNSVWSEEDEKMLTQIINEIEAIKSNSSTVFEKNIAQDKINWLKSLKPQNTWKPSDAQMASITCAVRKMKESACYDSELVSLYQDLKKLRGE